MYQKVLLTQFAIPNLNTLEYKSNIHLAPGYLVSYAEEFINDIDFIITPRIYTDIISEKYFIDYAICLDPDLYVFSLYLWNIEKCLRVVDVIKRMKPDAKFLFGGPEVNEDNIFLLNHPNFDIGIVGEGEVSFTNFLLGKSKDEIAGYISKDFFNEKIELRENYDKKNSIYTENIIEIEPDTTLFFETVRGCPFTCSFCYYNKVYDKIVPVGHDHLAEIFTYARKNGFRELFILDPTFNMQPNFNKLLDKMIELNHDKYFKISTELRADYLTDEQIAKLKQMNIVEVEIGLQTTNVHALKNMGRENRIKETIERTQVMMDHGIDCKVDLIIGLPSDTIENFKRSVDDVFDNQIDANMQVFLLSILSGTQFSKEKKTLGIVSDDIPPYYIESNDSFSKEDITEAIEYTEERLDISLYPLPPYLLCKNFDNVDSTLYINFKTKINVCHKLIISNIVEFDEIRSVIDGLVLSETLILHFIIKTDDITSITMILIYIKETFPHSILQLILEFESTVYECMIMKIYNSISTDNSYLNRDAQSNMRDYGNYTKSVAVLAYSEYISEVMNQDERYNLFLKVSSYDEEFIEGMYENYNLFFEDDSQALAFEYLKSRDLLDDFTLFESYYYESLKEENQSSRIYNPNIISI